ncbi:carboxypeptidase A1-like [Elysia marginata]|uniref:Carboxypeptidase A1-like n=1 Tax=Elysia marginata TaxID=1093978 RepID=A0AAV4JPS4_9GAST|nr:carboxypeptidase A1-like [Elysia marginata]
MQLQVIQLIFLNSIFVFILSLFTQIAGVDVQPQKEKYEPNYTYYHNVSSIESVFRSLVAKHSDFIQLNNDYKSSGGRSQLVLRMTNFSSRVETATPAKVRLLLSFGEHAREFFPVESMLYFISNVTCGVTRPTLDKPSTHKFSAWVLNNFDIIIIGMANPDGRDFIEQTRNYCWRGTKSGVDINRNFDWNFGGKGSSNNPQDGEFRGPGAFSEQETEVFRNMSFMFAPDAFVSFHSGVRHIYIPFADSKSRQGRRQPVNKTLLIRLARYMSRSSPSRPFKFGLAYDLTGYTADGTSFDFMAGHAKTPFSLAVELWEHKRHEGRSCFDEFNPRSEALQAELVLVHPLYVELLNFMHKWKQEHFLRTRVKKDFDSLLIRRKKDDGHQRLPIRKNSMFFSEDLKEGDDSDAGASLPNQLMFLMVFILTVALVAILVRHACQMVRKKRIISLRSLSATFSLLKLS